MSERIGEIISDLLKTADYDGVVEFKRRGNGLVKKEVPCESDTSNGNWEVSFRPRKRRLDVVGIFLGFFERVAPYVAVVMIAQIVGYYVAKCLGK